MSVLVKYRGVTVYVASDGAAADSFVIPRGVRRAIDEAEQEKQEKITLQNRQAGMSDAFKNGKLYDGATDADVQDMTGVSIDWIQWQVDRMREIRAYNAMVIAEGLRMYCKRRYRRRQA